MFVSFAYTECVSPGPFKKESGFKFKSVVQNAVGQSSSSISDSELQILLDKASGAFLPYRAPEIDPFMTREQFNALDKQFSIQRLDESHTMFTRMFTSGVSNGRPGNPFHQGFVFSKSKILAIVRSTADMADLEFARPVDFNDWADWLNPKGDAELEASELEQDNPPLPGKDDNSWKLSIESLFKSQPQAVFALLSEFESALRESRTCKVFSIIVYCVC
jgi:predicted molibdopterin-dependent oxidoreductase YjgC